jgi:hypothetical protein
MYMQQVTLGIKLIIMKQKIYVCVVIVGKENLVRESQITAK